MRQEEFSELVGCARPTLQTIEHGRVQLSEEIAIRASVATGASVAWLLQNDLHAPIISRSGTPYGTEHFVFAQIEKSGWHYQTFKSGAPDEYYESIVAAAGRLYNIFNYVSAAEPEVLDIVKTRLERFLTSLEKDFGEDEHLDQPTDSKARFDHAGFHLKRMMNEVSHQDRARSLQERQQRKLSEESATLADIRSRIKGLNSTEISRLIETMRAEREASFRDQAIDHAATVPNLVPSPWEVKRPRKARKVVAES